MFHEENTRIPKIKNTTKNQFQLVKTISLLSSISYLCLNDSDSNIVYSINSTSKFSIDIRDPQSVCYLQDKNKDNAALEHEDTIIEYNQSKYITFAYRLQKNVLIYNVRRVT